MSSNIDLDCSNAGRGVWLVKVPKYISQRWEKQKPMTEVGRLKIIPKPLSNPEIFFNLIEDKSEANQANNTSANNSATKNISKLPQTLGEHTFTINDIKNQTLAVFSQIDNKSLALEGSVVQKAECKPVYDARYMLLKKESIRMASQPTKIVKKIDRAVNNFKPINAHRSEIENDLRKKAEGKKMRDDKDVVQNALFAAFEKHQYYNIKDLERITKQPVPYLKEILKEICNYNAKNPHKNMWELKPQFRHYKKDN